MVSHNAAMMPRPLEIAADELGEAAKADLCVLVVDDDAEVRRLIGNALFDYGVSISEAEDLKEAVDKLGSTGFCHAFVDKCLPDGDGVEFARHLRGQIPGMLVTIITGQGSGEEAVQAMDDGIFDYIPKPCKVSEIRESFRRGVPEIGASEMEDDGVPLGGGDPTAKELVVIARSRAMIHMLRQAHKIAKMNRPVLIQGETGTGKEVVARKIHAMSSRGDKKFIPVNCGAIPQELIESELFGHIKGSFTGADKDRIGLFEEASGGTIFLDEVTETSPAFQVKLLRVLQEGKLRRVGSNQEVRVDVRVIAACNKNVLDEVAQNRFRQDLYFRLTGSEIYLPPLKERREDIIPLAEHFAAKTAWALETQVILSKSVKKVLQGFDWPGNVRQLENAIDYAVQSCNGTVLLSDLPRNLQVTVGDVEEDEKTVIGTAEEVLPLAEVERRYIAQVMRMCGGNKTKAAKLLGVSRRSFYNKTSGADTVDGEIEAAADQ